MPAAGASGDSELMKLIQRGSTHAFEELYDRYAARAYRVARSACADSGRAEDAVQEAFTSIWRDASAYARERGSVAAWLLTTVRHRAIDGGRRHRSQLDRAARASLLVGRPVTGEPVEGVLAREAAARLREQLERLPDAQREVVVLAFYGQLTHSEIATHLQLPAGTIKGRMSLGLQKLREAVEEAA
jgi:RNA polymerase sigma-70 factor, ECF subfamily